MQLIHRYWVGRAEVIQIKGNSGKSLGIFDSLA